MIEAPICTVGPSRPIEAPNIRPASVKPALPSAMRMDSRWVLFSLPVALMAAMVCGIPLPCEPGKNRRPRYTSKAKPAGMYSKGASGCRLVS